MPVKDPHTRIKPLAFASGHGRYIHIYCNCHALVSFGEWPLHIILYITVIDLHCNRFTAETVT
jgi:hypothetical protein